jgi:pentatricopeptide repeat protein
MTSAPLQCVLDASYDALLKLMEERGSTPDEAMPIFEDMKKAGIAPDLFTFKVISPFLPFFSSLCEAHTRHTSLSFLLYPSFFHRNLSFCFFFRIF